MAPHFKVCADGFFMSLVICYFRYFEQELSRGYFHKIIGNKMMGKGGLNNHLVVHYLVNTLLGGLALVDIYFGEFYVDL